MSGIDGLPPFVISENVFVWLDAAAYFSVVRTCRRWYSLANTHSVWQNMLLTLQSGISMEARRLLEREEEIQSLNEIFEKIDLNQDQKILEKLKNTYRILQTSFIIKTSDISSNDLETLNATLSSGTNHHKILRSQRIFSSLQVALEHANTGDYIYISEGKFEEEVTVTKSVHIFGSRVKKDSEDGDNTGYILKTRFTKPITWNTTDGGVSSLHHSFLTEEANTIIQSADVSLRRVVFSGSCHVIVGDGANVGIWSSDFRNCSRAIKVMEGFRKLEITASYFSDHSFDITDVIKVINKLKELISSGGDTKQIIALCHTLDSIAELNNAEHVSCLLRENIIPLLFDAMGKYADSEQVLYAVVLLFNTILLTEHTDLTPIFKQINFVPCFESMIRRHSNCVALQEWISVCLWNLLDQVSSLPYFTESIHKALLESLHKHHSTYNVAFETISFFWHSAHRLLHIRPLLIEHLPLFAKVLDSHQVQSYSSNHSGQESDKLMKEMYNEVMGLIWNLSSKETTGKLSSILPHAVKALSLASDETSLNTALGAFLLVFINCTEEERESLMQMNILNLILELKERKEMKGDAQKRLWKSFAWLSKTKKAQSILPKLIECNRTHPPLKEIDRIKILQSLTIQNSIDPSIYTTLQEIIKTTTEMDVFFYCMDSTVHLMTNKSSTVDRPKAMEIANLLFERSSKFTHHRKIREWLGWARKLIYNEPTQDSQEGLDPNRSVGVHIAPDGLLCRHAVASVFGTALGSICVSEGKWYYEVEFLSEGSFQIGWATSQFKPSPEEGKGVGDDQYGWAVDLKRHARWHEDENGSLRSPYGQGVTLDKEIVMQCYLDLEQCVMSFGYNGKALGPAFEGFRWEGGLYPVVSLNLETECRFIFNAASFKYTPPEHFLPLVKHKIL